MFHRLLVAALCLPLFQDVAGPTRSAIPDRDLQKVGKDIQAYFEAKDKDDRSAQAEVIKAIQAEVDKAAKKAKVEGDFLEFVGDWDFMLEDCKSPDRELSASFGKGFTRYVFTDPFDQGERRVVSLISVPAAAKDRTRLPAVLVLKNVIGAEGKDLESAVAERAAAMYAPLMESHIILVPLGLEVGAARKAVTHEVEDGWLSTDGFFVCFTSLRLLFERLSFDRSRLVLDGWGDAGLDALRIASGTPYFAAVVLRSSPVESPDLIYSNLARKPVLYVKGADDSPPATLGALEGMAEVMEVAGSALGAPEGTAIADWIKARQKDLSPDALEFRLRDDRFGATDWCTVSRFNARVTAKPEDKDFPCLKASIDRDTNTVKLETVNVLDLRIYLNDDLLDLDKPITVQVNGEPMVKQKRVDRSLRHLLDTRYFQNSGDYGVYTASIELEGIDPNTSAN